VRLDLYDHVRIGSCHRGMTQVEKDTASHEGSSQAHETYYQIRGARSLVIWRHLIVNEPYQRYPHLSCVVPSQHIADEMALDLH
jgi:hypothetical protein